MNARDFAFALRADSTARVFIDTEGNPAVAQQVEGRWVAHGTSTEAGAEICEDRLFAPGNVSGWRAEEDRVKRERILDLLMIELAESLPETIAVSYSIKFPIEFAAPGVHVLERREEVCPGERFIVVHRSEVSKYPGAVVLDDPRA
jgi:hypothetical protein